MRRRLGLIVTDASPLITLAAGEALDCLTMPGLPVIIPDMVYFEVTRDFAELGVEDIVQWARQHHGQVEILPTTVFAEYQALQATNPRIRSKGRGEAAALEVLNVAIANDPDFEAVLFFEDSDVRKPSFVRGLPERVTALSTGDLLHELEAAGRIQSSDQILNNAAAEDRNVAAQREPAGRCGGADIVARASDTVDRAVKAEGLSGLWKAVRFLREGSQCSLLWAWRDSWQLPTSCLPPGPIIGGERPYFFI